MRKMTENWPKIVENEPKSAINLDVALVGPAAHMMMTMSPSSFLIFEFLVKRFLIKKTC